ncbi:hypothetical protein ACFFRR_006171 [Megaselia abdita]
MKSSAISIAIFYICCTKAFIVFKVFTLDYYANETFFENTKCTLRSVDRYHSYIDIETNLIRTLYNISGHGQLFSCYNNCHPFLMNITFNACTNRGNTGSYFVNMVYRIFARSPSNFNFGRCPYLKGFIYLRNLTANVNIFKIFPIPDNTYKFIGKIYENEGNTRMLIFRMSYKFNLYRKYEAEGKERVLMG